MKLAVALRGSGIMPHNRTLHVELGPAPPQGSFVGEFAAPLGDVPSELEIRIPATTGYTCVSVKDVGHTLRQAAPVHVSGREYVAVFTGAAPSGDRSLVQGDSNNDNTVDILDFSIFIADRATGVDAGARSNFNGDSSINTTDFSFISFAFFQVGAVTCADSGHDGGLAGDGPLERVTVAQLRRLGFGDLSVADLNGDGWVDLADMALWAGGVRPEEHAGEAGESQSASE